MKTHTEEETYLAIHDQYSINEKSEEDLLRKSPKEKDLESDHF